MNITEYKGFLENLVHDSLYIFDKLDKEKKDTLKDIIKYLHDSEDYFSDFRILVASRNNENYFAYDEYIASGQDILKYYAGTQSYIDPFKGITDLGGLLNYMSTLSEEEVRRCM